jgi:hypothetical protein
VAENLARDLVFSRRRDLDELGLGRRKAVLAREIVAEDGLKMAVLQEAPRLEIGRLKGTGCKCC